MTRDKKMSLRLRLQLLVTGIVLFGFAITLTLLSRQTSALQHRTALQYTTQLATSEGNKVTRNLEQALDAARTLAQGLSSLKSSGLANRASADALLKGVLSGNPAFLGVWTGWEPDAFDGQDSAHAGQPGHDASGRYVPYWNRGNASATSHVEPLVDYDKPGAGDFYQLAKASGQETVLEPYLYPLAGQSVLMTSLVVPIQIDGRFVGVAGIDLALSSLQQAVEPIRIYDTGFASLLSNKGVVVGDHDPHNVGQDMGRGESLDLARAAIAQGRSIEIHLFSERLQTDVTRIYVPIQIGASKTPWSFAATVPNDTILAEVRQLRLSSIGLGLISTLLVSLGLAWALNRLVLRPIGGEPDDAAAMAARVAQGNLSQPIQLRANDSTSLMAQLQQMQGSLASVVASVRQGAEGVATASAQIAQGNHDLSGRTESQASALEQTAASMEQLNSTVTQNADNARHATQLARSASSVAAQGGAAVARVIDTMKDINDSSHKIADIIGVIDSIAFQTNILALNAAVEAARAGEQGRGFAVVASEVRSLAGRSANAAKEIRSLIDTSVNRVEAGTAQVDQAGHTMTEVVQSIQQVADLMSAISAASAEQSAGVGQVGEAIVQMDQVTQQNAALVEEMAAAASSLQTQAQDLVQTVAVFQLDSGHAQNLIQGR
ncbi:methyl-accepting chemotaxis protein [Simplicispira psychrophila]|uniref:methyl-accepting chemotaxis protein n=1 Tax=Simplicispira psychrophila TaxID=80882 RepID=UPI00048364D2|nr:methyl-accepting chemotaxis protein [Simplicispira psychrophila]